MNLHHAIILNGLQELSNATQFGQPHRVTFTANVHEHWLLCTPTEISMDWPFASSPAESGKLEKCFGAGLQISAWEADAYVTFAPRSPDVDALIAGIERVFRDLYCLGSDYTLTYEVEEG